MRAIRPHLLETTPFMAGLRVLLVGSGGSVGFGPAAVGVADRQIVGLGAAVDMVPELFTGLEAMIEDPTGYGLFVLVCDEAGGVEAGRRALALLRGAGCRVPAILVAADCAAPIFPDNRDAPAILPVEGLARSLRPAMAHALRDRLLWRAA